MAFEKGQINNPRGRPKGSRHKLGESFLSDVHLHWIKNGSAALDAALAEGPMEYIKAIVSILPKEAVLNVQHSYKSEPVSTLDEFLTIALSAGQDSETEEPLPH